MKPNRRYTDCGSSADARISSGRSDSATVSDHPCDQAVEYFDGSDSPGGFVLIARTPEACGEFNHDNLRCHSRVDPAPQGRSERSAQHQTACAKSTAHRPGATSSSQSMIAPSAVKFNNRPAEPESSQMAMAVMIDRNVRGRDVSARVPSWPQGLHPTPARSARRGC